MEEYRKKSPNACNNRRRTYNVSQQCNNLFMYDNPYPRKKMHEGDISSPVKSKVNNDKKNRKYSKPASNVSNDNRRMTGNVNIYICSEANDNNRAKNKQKLKLQPCTDTSSDTVTEQSNSRCISTSSMSSCKLISSIKEKRRKLQAQQPSNFVQDNIDRIDSSNNSIVCDNGTSSGICRRESNESNKEQMDVTVTDEEVKCENTVSSTRDGCCCKDTSFSITHLRQNSSDFMVPCSSVCDNSKLPPQSWTTIYTAEPRAKLDDSEFSLSNALYVERESNHKNDDRDDICRNDNKYTMCDAIDGGNWLPKSIYTDCTMYEKIAKECSADSCKYRNKNPQGSVSNRNDIWRRQMGYKSLRQSPVNCQREHIARRWSTCSCITEEDEDCCTNIDRMEGMKIPENLNHDTRGAGISGQLAEDATVCETPFNNAAGRFEGTRRFQGTFGDLAEYTNGITVCGATLENSEEPKVTRVCKEFVAEEASQDITVCKTIFAEPKEPEEVTICETTLLDSKEAPQETIGKMPDWNFIKQDDTTNVFLNDAKGKLMKEKIDDSGLNNQKENSISTKQIVKSDGKHNSIVSNNFTGPESVNDVKQDERVKESIANNPSRTPPVPEVGSIRYSKPLLKEVYPRKLPSAKLQPNIASIHDTKKTLKASIDQRKLLRMQLPPLYRPMRTRFQQMSKVPKNLIKQDFVLSKKDQTAEKIQEKSKKEDEKRDIMKEIEIERKKLKDTLLQRFRKLIDVTKTKAQARDRTKTEKDGSVKADDKKDDIRELESILETGDKITSEKGHQVVRENVQAPVISPFANKREDKKTDIYNMDQKTSRILKSKLLSVIAAKKLQPTEIAVGIKAEPREPKMDSLPVEITANEHADKKEISQRTISAEITEEIKTEELPAPEKVDAAAIIDIPKDVTDIGVSKDTNDISKDVIEIPKDIAEISRDLIDSTKDVADIPKDIIEKNGIWKDVDETTKFYVPCPRKKLEEEPQKFVPCKYGAFDPGSRSCVVIKCIKCNRTLKDCLCNGHQQTEDCCQHCYLSTAQCTCASTQYLKSCLKINKPRFHSVSPSKNSPYVYTDCCGIREDCKFRKAAVCFHCCRSYEECRCRSYVTHNNYSSIIGKCKCKTQASCINCCGSRDECACCATSAMVKYHNIKKDCGRKKTMICLYCDNPQDKCICRAPIGKCSYCGLPSDVCNCQEDEVHKQHDCEQVVTRSTENRTIQVSSWKPKREVKRYFARNPKDPRLDITEECYCHERPKRQHAEELPYQRLNIFSDVMNELQQKMSESVCYTRCRRNPCCCKPQIERDEGKRERKAKGYVRCPEVETTKSKSPNNCQCSPSFKSEHKNNVKKSASIRCIDCAYKLSPCKCRKSKTAYKRPLAKCYYCKSLPCTCTIAR